MLCDHIRNALSRIEKVALIRPAFNEISVELFDAPEQNPAWGKVVGMRR
jgi:hypothetical protein